MKPKNTAPVVEERTFKSYDGNSIVLSLNAADAEGDVLAYNIIENPSNGVLSGIPLNIIYIQIPVSAGRTFLNTLFTIVL